MKQDVPTLILQTALDLLSKSDDAWTQAEMARDANGEPSAISSERATCFCSLGAVAKARALRNEGRRDVFARESHAELAAGRLEAVIGGDLIEWNDAPGRTVDEVRDAFRRAIEAGAA